MNIRKKYENII